MSYYVIVDTREKLPYTFQPNDYCEGFIKRKLELGDYSLEKYEEILVVERKRTTAELAINVFEDRFDRELEKISKVKYGFVLCEFSLTDILEFPVGSGIPTSRWDTLKVKPALLLKRVVEYMTQYHSNFIFCDNALNAQKILNSIFKRVCEIECL